MHNTLQFRINMLFLLLMAAMACTVILVIKSIGTSMITKENYRFIEQKGQTIVAHLGQQVNYAEAMARALTAAAQTLPKNDTLFKEMIRQILYGTPSRIKTAGGGIWPEPYAFSPEKQRNSFFWGHDSSDHPVLFTGYNDPGGPGYHAEEWYVPARYLDPAGIYWSKSYVDPYSGEPMVTCTVPYYSDGDFAGAATVDLKLEGLKTFLDNEARELNGYIFVVDRHNKFLSFPDPDRIREGAPGNQGRPKGFIHTRQLADKAPGFSALAQALDRMNEDILNRNPEQRNHRKALAGKLAAESYQIPGGQAEMIAAALDQSGQTPAGHAAVQIHIKNDMLLNAPAMASIFLMPQTSWKIVIVTPRSHATRVADHISRRILIHISLGLAICILIAYLYLRSALIIPLRQMTGQLINPSGQKGWHPAPLTEHRNNELGELAFWFNRRTEQLHISNKRLSREIRSHEHSQNALKESEQRLSFHLRNTPIGALSLDLDFRVTEWNPAAEKIFAYTRKEVLGRSVFDLIIPEKTRAEVSTVLNDLLSGQGLKRNINENMTRDGRIILCDWYNTVLKDRDGRITGIASLVNDITDQKKTQEMMIQSEKMLSIGGLAAGMAHELNNPLAGMVQNAQVIRNRLTRDLPANEKAAETLGIPMSVIKSYMEARGIPGQLDNIYTAGQRAAKIIENMLSFAKKSESVKKENHLAQLIEDTLALAENDYSLKKNFDFKSMEIVREFSPDLPPVPCEKIKIQQVIFNILKNASEAISDNPGPQPPPRLTLRLYRDSAMACMEIQDNGPGIDDPTRKRIFEPFFTTKGVNKGTGLGLSVSYYIITHDHGGEMAVESTPGKGSRFIIKLPFVQGKAPT